MNRFFTLLTRGILLRCPVCGKGKLFRTAFSMYKECPVCHLKYEREEGYFSSAMAVDLILSELIVTAVVVPMAIMPSIPLLTTILVGVPLAALLPVVFFCHSRGIWMSMDHYLNPISISGRPRRQPQPIDQNIT